MHHACTKIPYNEPRTSMYYGYAMWVYNLVVRTTSPRQTPAATVGQTDSFCHTPCPRKKYQSRCSMLSRLAFSGIQVLSWLSTVMCNHPLLIQRDSWPDHLGYGTMMRPGSQFLEMQFVMCAHEQDQVSSDNCSCANKPSCGPLCIPTQSPP